MTSKDHDAAARIAMTEAEKRFEALFDAHYGDVLAYAVRRCATVQEAEDVAAETFAVAWRRIHDLPDGHEARLWLFGTARLVRFNHRRAHHRRRGLLDRIRSRFQQPQSGPDSTVPEADQIRRALAGLKQSDREVLQLHVWEQLTAAEIATALETSEVAVWKRLQRARDRLREELEDAADPALGSAPALTPPTRKEAR